MNLVSLLDNLETQELLFNEEIHNLVTNQKRVLPVMEPDGFSLKWLVTYAEKNSADWTIAKYCGKDSTLDRGDLLLLPQTDIRIFLPEEICIGIDSKISKSIHVFSNFGQDDSDSKVSSSEIDAEIQEIESYLLANFKIQIKSRVRLKSYFEGQYRFEYLSFYFLVEDEIVAYIKAIHETKNTIEPYIEVNPFYRGRGVGEKILKYFYLKHQLSNKFLIYQVEEENLASTKIAKKCGLKKIHTWNSLDY